MSLISNTYSNDESNRITISLKKKKKARKKRKKRKSSDGTQSEKSMTKPSCLNTKNEKQRKTSIIERGN